MEPAGISGNTVDFCREPPSGTFFRMPSVSLSLPSALAGRARTWVCLSCMFWVRNRRSRCVCRWLQMRKATESGLFLSRLVRSSYICHVYDFCDDLGDLPSVQLCLCVKCEEVRGSWSKTLFATVDIWLKRWFIMKVYTGATPFQPNLEIRFLTSSSVGQQRSSSCRSAVVDSPAP